METAQSIAGGWLGTYRYGGIEAARKPVRFEASFRTGSVESGIVYGEIVDDCLLGVASVDGSQAGYRVRFSKEYRRGSRFEVIGRTEYCGLISDDGMVMRGVWRLDVTTRGVLIVRGQGAWDARRMWGEEDEPHSVTESESASAANRSGSERVRAVSDAW